MDGKKISSRQMREIRIGNDLSVKWEILTNGEPKPLEGRDLRLFLWHSTGSRELTDFSVGENVITWAFPGREQRFTGDYILTLVENKGMAGMGTVDQTGFRLVARMFGTNGLSEPEEVNLGTAGITISSAGYPVATEDRDGLMPKEDKRLVNACRADLEALTDEVIHGWFYGDGE